MLDRSKLPRGWLNRYAYPMIINAQRMRWTSEGTSEGEQWAPLKSKRYAAWKLRKYADSPGGGRHLLIARSRLAQGAMGDNTADHYKLVTDTTLEVGTTIDYAKYVNDARNFTNLGPDTMKQLSDSLAEYIMTGSA